jgi:nuclear inhibitor of protein phosphatase 1
VLDKVKSTTRGGIYDDLYGDSVPAKLGSSWAYKSDSQSEQVKAVNEKKSSKNVGTNSADDSDDDLFGH